MTKQNISVRDTSLDKLRGLAMLYIMVIHTLYGVGLFSGKLENIVKSYFLIEMPVFFFIAGASNYYSRYTSKLSFYISRFQRILIPYYIYAFIIVILNFIVPKLQGINFEFDLFYWIMPLGGGQQSFSGFFTGALWFIPTYLFVMILFPFMKSYFERKHSQNSKDIYLPVFFFLFGMFIINFFDMDLPIWILRIICYGFFTYLGMFWIDFKDAYSTNKKRTLKKLFVVLLLCIVAYCLLISTGNFNLDMQRNKQQCNIAFMVYGIIGICFVGIIHQPLLKLLDFVCKCKPIGWIFKQFEKHTYTIYLFHMIALYIVSLIIAAFITNPQILNNDYYMFFIRLIPLTIIAAILGFLLHFIEKIKIYDVKKKA